MSDRTAVLLTLIAYKLVLVGIGLWASRRTQDATDFYLGGRRLGGWVAALSASASSSSAWTLLGVSGAAYAWGFSALWLFPATVGGFVINWFWIAPQIRKISRESGAITLTELIAGAPGTPHRAITAKLGSVIVLFSFSFYVAAQFQAAGDAFSSTFGLSIEKAVLLGAGVVLVYTLLGGFWAVSVTDTLQGLLMMATAVVLPVIALARVGGPSGLSEGLAETAGGGSLSLLGGRTGIVAIGFVLGTLGIGLGYPGQPHVINRFMALRDDEALRHGRVIALLWAIVVYSGMLTVGLCGRVLVHTVEADEQIFFALTHELLPPVIAGIMIAAVLSAIMSTADSQLLVAASAVSHDWRLGGRGSDHLWIPRVVVVALSALAACLALWAPEAIFSRVLFAWHAIGSAFGPTVLLRAAGFDIRSRAKIASITVGFALTVYFNWQPNTPGDWLERLLPLAIAIGIAIWGRMRPADGSAGAHP